MGAQLRIYRRRIRSVRATAKITRAMELIAASRIVKAQQRVVASTPYAEAITRAVSAVASQSNVDHPLLTERARPVRAAVLLVTSDRGLAGAYSANVLREGEALTEHLRERGLDVVHYIVGRKGLAYYRFRDRPVVRSWLGFSENPGYLQAKDVADTLIAAFNTPADDGGVDEIHVVYTKFVSMLTQTPEARRILPLEVEETTEEPVGGMFPQYEFEPNAAGVLDALLPRYVEARIYNALLQGAASELAARRRACKAATDNAEELIRTYTRLANAARQAEITQEISEIVGGADALVATGSE
ncbi:MAG: F0F1 ATP synthase subunit gamma [Acidothermus cellulolyticus]|nr:F0F1 ATP synthase subunit gamma [Acidothermus cellulolyticus]MCL6550104.1 F0F1 ATP synthase subunit gamma [Acidothermus cellulolyticus]